MIRRLLPLLLIALLPLACTDSDSGPAGPGGDAGARLALAPSFAVVDGEAAQDEIVRVRLTALHGVTGDTLQDPTDFDVNPADSIWELPLEVQVPEDGAAIRVLIELLDATGETEWSGLTDPVQVRAGEETTAPETELHPGPPGNLEVDSVSVIVPADTLVEEDTVRLDAETFGGEQDEVRVVWSSLEPDVATVDDEGLVTALLPGAASIEAIAGPARDTAHLVVLPRIAAVGIEPAEPVLSRAGETVTLEATLLDPRGEPVEGGTIVWSVDDETVATHLGGGTFEAVGEGTTEITAASEDDPDVQGSVLLTVAVPDLRPVSIEVTSPEDGRIAEGEPVVVVVRATNEGGSAAPATALALGVLDAEGGQEVRADTVVETGALEAGDTVAVEISLAPPPAGAWPSEVLFRTTADAEATVAELDEDDNVLLGEGVGVVRSVASLEVAPTADTVVAPGDTARFTASPLDALGGPLERPVEWTSLDPEVATVDTAGLATAASAGSARIVAAAEGVADTTTFVVLGLPDLLPEELVIATPAPDTVVEADSIGVAVTVRNAGGSEAPATTLALRALDASDPGVVLDDTLVAVPALPAGGTFHFEETFDVDPGSWSDGVLFEASADDTEGVPESDEQNNAVRTGTFVVRRAGTSLEVAPAADTVVTAGDTARFDATVRAFDGTELDEPVEWRSLDPAVADVDDHGLATALSSGSARIVASAGDLADTASLVVLGRPDLVPEGLTVTTPVPDTIAEGDSIEVAVAVRNAGGSTAPATTLALRVLDAADVSVVLDDTLVAVPTLEAGASFHFDETFGVDPDDAWSDRVVLQAEADVGDGSDEADETNNALLTSEFGVRRAPTSIVVDPAADTVTASGDTVRFTAEVRGFDGRALDHQVTWATLDAHVVEVDGSGLATALGAGSGRIVASAGEVADTAHLLVTGIADLHLSSLVIGGAVGDTIVEGDTLEFAATVRNEGDADAPPTTFAVRFLDAATHQLLADSLVQTPPVPAGDSVDLLVRYPVPDVGGWPANVRLEGAADAADALEESDESDNSGGPATAFSIRRQVAFIVVSPEVDTLLVSDSVRLGAQVFAADESLLDRPVTWHSLSPDVAEVDSAGLVRAGSPGGAGIVATADGAADTARIVVLGAPDLVVQGLGLEPVAGDTVFEGDTLEVVATVGNAGASEVPATELRIGIRDASTDIPLVDSLLPIPMLAPGDSAQVSLAFPLVGLGTWPAGIVLEAAADAGELVAEVEEGNNLFDEGTVFVVRRSVSFVLVEPGTVTLDLGDTVALAATVFAADETVLDRPVTWSVLDSTLATVSTEGELIGLLAGSTTVLATADGVSGQASLDIVQPAPELTLVSVTTGRSHTCHADSTGVPRCWGWNGIGQLGDGTFTDRRVPRPVSGEHTFVLLTAGDMHTCGLTPDDEAWCWGDNFSGELGIGPDFEDSWTPAAVAGSHSFASLTAGEAHTCGVDLNGIAYCWGDNDSGELGDGTTVERAVPTAVSGGHQFAQLSAGYSHTCGVTTTDHAYCWGDNRRGILGDGSEDASPTPAAVAGQLAFSSITAGDQHTCGVTPAGTAYCWGDNGAGQLGDSTRVHRFTPTRVSGGHTFARLSTGFSFTCGLTTAGAAYCWGENGHGQVGNGTTSEPDTPMPVSGGHVFESIDTGQHHACGVTTAGEMLCWGINQTGQLGDGSFLSSLVPTPVPIPPVS